VENRAKVTDAQLKAFLDMCWIKFVKAKIEPGRIFLFDILPVSVAEPIEQDPPLVPLVLNPLENRVLR
jgi:hypothetical protein